MSDTNDFEELEDTESKKKKKFGVFSTSKEESHLSPRSSPAIKVLITTIIIGLIAYFFLGENTDSSLNQPTVRSAGERAQVLAQEPQISADEQARILAENEERREKARDKRKLFTPDRMVMHGPVLADPALTVAQQAKQTCDDIIARGVEQGADPKQIMAQAAAAVAKLAKERGATPKEAIKAAEACANKAAQHFKLSGDEAIAAIASAVSNAAQAVGLSEDDQVAIAAAAAQRAAAALGYTKEEQIAAAARAAAAAANALGWTEERQVEAAAKAAREAAAALGLSEEEQVAAAAKAAAAAAKDLGWSEERQVEAAAKAAREAAEALGWSEERQVEAAAKAAAAAAKDLGWSKQRQIDAAAKAALDAAKALGWSDEKAAAAAAKAALDAARALGLNPEEQMEAVKHALQIAVDSLPLTDAEKLSLYKKLMSKVEERTGVKASTQSANSANSANARTQHNSSLLLAAITRISEEKNKRNQETELKPTISTYSTIERPTAIVDLPEESKIATTAELTSNTLTLKTVNKDPLRPDVAMGEFLYGVQITRVNTDTPTKEVVAQVVGGPFSGARLIGSWQQNSQWGETIGLRFNRMSYKGQQVSGVDLVAFDTESGLPGFATKVDRHLLQRFVGISMTAFGAGASAAINARRETKTVVDEFERPTAVQQSAIDSKLAEELFLARTAQEFGTFGQEWQARPITIDTYNEQFKLLSLNDLFLPGRVEGEK